MTDRTLPPLIGIVCGLLVAGGLVCLASISKAVPFSPEKGQLFWLAPALAIGLFAAIVPFDWFLRRAYFFYALGLGLLILVPVIGIERNGSQRWLLIGGQQLQPSEPMKVLCLLAMARYLRYRTGEWRLQSLFAIGGLAAVPVALIFLQPDLGTATLFVPAALGMLFVSGMDRRQLLVVMIGGMILAGASYSILEPYQKERILSTVMRHRLTPAQRQREGYQLEQSLRSVGSGRWFGAGWGDGVQNRLNKLPHRHNDFIFSVLAEEFGFFGGVFVLLLMALLVLLMFRVAMATREPGGRMFCVGAGILYAFQSIVHVGVTLGVVPTTGMTLPFVSYGGSALVTFAMMTGLVVNIARSRPPVLSGGDTTREQMERLRSI